MVKLNLVVSKDKDREDGGNVYCMLKIFMIFGIVLCTFRCVYIDVCVRELFVGIFVVAFVTC